MSLDDLIESDMDDVFLDTDDFAVTITRYPSGDTDSGESVTAVFSEFATGTAQHRDYSRGKETVRVGKLTVKSDQTVTQSDQWLINSELWQTLEIPGANFGAREIMLQRNDIQSRDTKGMGVGRL